MGGSKPSAPTYIQPPPPQIIQSPVQPPNPGETAAQVAQARLQYDPQLAAQQFQLYQQYAPQTAQIQSQIYQQQAPGQAQAEFDIQRQIAPQQRALYEQLLPTQTAGLETLAQQSLQRLQSPQSLTPEQQAQQDFMRQRSREQIQRNVRESANVGGTLYGGRRQEREDEALRQYEAGLLDQDLNRQYQNRAQTLQELVAAQQAFFPTIQSPGVAQGFAPQYQSAAPSPDALLQSVLQANSNYIVNPAQYQPGNPGTPGFFGSFVQGFGGRGF